jgi:uracil-DNA glycosylase family protein
MPKNTELGAELFVPANATTIDDLRDAATDCRGCQLFHNATQTVFGAGPAEARVVMVGEQPGDVEDRKGMPFVGPAGALLDLAIVDAGLDRRDTYVTNAVKHFKFTRSERGKRRIHQTPDTTEITACRPWLVAELALLRPEVVVVLGATAAKALLGPSFRVTRSRGELLPWPRSSAYAEDFPVSSGHVVATFHPSAVLRADDRDAAYADLVSDLTVVAGALS